MDIFKYIRTCEGVCDYPSFGCVNIAFYRYCGYTNASSCVIPAVGEKRSSEMINFMGKKWLYFLISAFFLLPGIVSLTMWGLKPSIDFTGGTFWELRFPENVDARKGEVIEIVQAQGVEVQVFQSSSSQVYRLRTKFMTSDTAQTILPKLKEKFGDVQEVRFGTVGPTLGAEFLRKTIIAVILAIFIILGYVAWTFKNVEYGVSAILALLHDTIILIGIFS